MLKLTLITACLLLAGICYGLAQEGDMQEQEGARAAMEGGIELIPREVIFGNPERMSPNLSPDGRYMAYIAPYNGVLNVWVRTVGAEDDRPLTGDTGRGVFQYFWAYDGEHLIYSQDRDGDENHRLYAVNIQTNTARTLTPDDPSVEHAVQSRVAAVVPDHPNRIIIGMNRADERIHDLYSLHLPTGNMEMVQQGSLEAMSWLLDNDLQVRGYMRAEPAGGATMLLRDGNEGDFAEVLQIPQEDLFTSGPVGFGPTGRTLYLVSSVGRNSAALYEWNLDTGAMTELGADPAGLYDVGDVLVHPSEHTVLAYAVARDRVEWTALTPEAEAVFERLRAFRDADFSVTNATLDASRLLVVISQDNHPTGWYAVDAAGGEIELLFYARPELLGKPLAQMRPVSFTARDGRTVHGYLTLPLDFEAPGPLVLNVHGGPWGRDSWGYNGEAQWLANRGYACLQVNFRGSTGYGKAFLNAGDREWGGAMQNDLSEAVAWAISEGIADPERVVIYGGSYGGYATLAGVTFTPQLYAGGISMVGPSNMETFLNSIPPYWESFRKQMDARVGMIPRYVDGPMAGMPKHDDDLTADERTEIEYLRSRSPLFHVDNVRVPMLIAQGANDPRVKRAESDQFAAALEAKGLQVEYVVYDDEGHGFARPENRLDFYRRAEKFLSEVLGGRYEE